MYRMDGMSQGARDSGVTHVHGCTVCCNAMGDKERMIAVRLFHFLSANITTINIHKHIYKCIHQCI